MWSIRDMIPTVQGMRRYRQRLFFTQPLVLFRHRGLKYHHLSRMYWYMMIYLGFFHVVPWILIGTLILFATKGCGWEWTRKYLEPVCLQPYRHPGNQIPWHLDLWNSSLGSLDQDPPSVPIEMVMTGHLTICDSGAALHDEMLRIKEISSGWTGELVDSLRQVTRVTSNLCPVLESFSFSYCIERDTMNMAFRDFVEAYAMTITRSHFVDLSTSSLILFPFWNISLRILNYYLLAPWLPEPALYSFQVKSEIRFQMRNFIDKSLNALDRIDTQSPLLGHSSNAVVETAIATVENYQQHLSSIFESHQPFSPLRYFLKKPDGLVIAEEHIALSNRIRNRLFTVLETLQLYQSHSARLRSQLQDLRKSFSPPEFEFSPKGLVAVPASLQDEVQHPPFEWHEDGEGNESARNTLTPHSHVYSYDLDKDNGSRPAELRLAIASLCRSRKNIDILSGALYMICSVWAHAATMSGLDKNTLGSVQRSWVVERMQAVHRYERRTGTDAELIRQVMEETHRNYIGGTPVPPKLSTRNSI